MSKRHTFGPISNNAHSHNIITAKNVQFGAESQPIPSPSNNCMLIVAVQRTIKVLRQVHNLATCPWFLGFEAQ